MHIPTLELHEATSYEDAVALLSRFSPDVRLLAGGTDVLVELKNDNTSVSHPVTLERIDAIGEKANHVVAETGLESSYVCQQRDDHEIVNQRVTFTGHPGGMQQRRDAT